MKQLKLTALISTLLFFFCHATVIAQPTSRPANSSVIQTMYNDFRTGNIPGVLASMSADVEWNEAESFPYWEGQPFLGPDAILKGVFAKIAGEWEYWNLVGVQLHNMENDMVLATGRYQARYKKNGALIDAQFAHVWTLKNGKVIKFQQYTDTKQVANAIQE